MLVWANVSVYAKASYENETHDPKISVDHVEVMDMSQTAGYLQKLGSGYGRRDGHGSIPRERSDARQPICHPFVVDYGRLQFRL